MFSKSEPVKHCKADWLITIKPPFNCSFVKLLYQIEIDIAACSVSLFNINAYLKYFWSRVYLQSVCGEAVQMQTTGQRIKKKAHSESTKAV